MLLASSRHRDSSAGSNTRASTTASWSRPTAPTAWSRLFLDRSRKRILRARGCVRQVPARLVDQPRDLLHLRVVDLFRTVVLRVVIGVQSGHETERRNAALQERPLIAAAHQV